MRVIVAPNSFKGSISAVAAARAIASGIRRAWPAAEIQSFPMADGGEGTLDAVLAGVEGERCDAIVTGAHGLPLGAAYARLKDGTVVIEVAQVVGLTLPGVGGVPVARRTTRGIGELLRQCFDQGARRFMVGLGGSATNDGGAGMLSALGARFKDAAGRPVEPLLQTLQELVEVDLSGLDPRLGECEITLLCDVDNSLCGEQGATAVFGPQKGVAAREARHYDGVLKHYAGLCDVRPGVPAALEPGSGAAGGLGFAFRLLGAQFRSGAEAICELGELDAAMAGADWVVTGEGRSDIQTLSGKAPYVIARHARRHGVPVTLLSGDIAFADRGLLAEWFGDIHALVSADVSPGRAMADAAALLADHAEALARSRG